MNRTTGEATAHVDVVPQAPNLAGRASAALAAYRAGQTHLLEAFVREATPLLWHIVRSQGVERDDADDVVQGVWLAFVRSTTTIREPEALLGWLVVSARRAAWEASRRRRLEAARTTQLPDGELAPARELRSLEPSPDEPVLTAERDRALWRLFSGLPERCQQILRMVAVADRPDYKAIAAAAGIQVTAVGVTRGRCLAKLRTLLDQDNGWVGA
ncbi:MAG: sigma-70 family RNA polymerase sigma factor [Cellulomonadaceae bacterium]|nr:sigma-70 family RNA polymerase sigma factor [Cellulomonadaceae bacterium]